MDDYDLQAEGTYGDFRWMFHSGNLWIYKDWEKDGYDFRIETNIQIKPFSTEKDIRLAVENTIAVLHFGYLWKTTKKKTKILSEHEKMMIAMWAKKLKEYWDKDLIFNKLKGKSNAKVQIKMS